LTCVLNSAESSAKKASWTSVKVGKSEVHKLKSVGERTAPCGTPGGTPHSADLSSATVTYNFRSVKKDQMCIPEVYEATHHATHNRTPFQRPTTESILSRLRVGDLSSVFHETQIVD
jgi:hypothetical protein